MRLNIAVFAIRNEDFGDPRVFCFSLDGEDPRRLQEGRGAMSIYDAVSEIMGLAKGGRCKPAGERTDDVVITFPQERWVHWEIFDHVPVNFRGLTRHEQREFIAEMCRHV